MRLSKQSRSTDPAWWTAQHTLLWEECSPELRRAYSRDQRPEECDELPRLGPDDALVQRHPAMPRNVSVDRAHAVPDDNWEVGAVWAQLEPALRFGAGARVQYSRFDVWTEELEVLLRNDWHATQPAGSWQRIKGAVRRGFEVARRKQS